MREIGRYAWDMVKYTKSEGKPYTHIFKIFQFIEQGDSQIRISNICIVQYQMENPLGQSNFCLRPQKVFKQMRIEHLPANLSNVWLSNQTPMTNNVLTVSK